MIDPFLWFCLSEEDRLWITKYQSPESESSLFKWIPARERSRARLICRQLGHRVRVVWRGPRRPGSSTTRRADATHFTLYPLGARHG